jgi:hypothetical protein
MEHIHDLLPVLLGMTARLMIPILVTVIAVYFLRRLDARWEKDARNLPARVQKPACWESKDCPPENSRACIGRTSPLPCWQARRTANGRLREACLGCAVLIKAPAPASR